MPTNVIRRTRGNRPGVRDVACIFMLRNRNPCVLIPSRNAHASYKTFYLIGRYLTPALILYRVIRWESGGWGAIETKKMVTSQVSLTGANRLAAIGGRSCEQREKCSVTKHRLPVTTRNNELCAAGSQGQATCTRVHQCQDK